MLYAASVSENANPVPKRLSTITATKSRTPSSDPCWIPSSLYRLTLEQYVPPHFLTVMIDGVEVGEIPVPEILP